MVDSIGSRPATGAVGATSAAPRVERVASRKDETVAAQLERSAVAFDYGRASPVDQQHVEEVRRAVRNGTYPILPETIADRLLALKLNWSPKK